MKALLQILDYAGRVKHSEVATDGLKLRVQLDPNQEAANFIDIYPQPDGTVRVRSLRAVKIVLDVSNAFYIEPDKY